MTAITMTMIRMMMRTMGITIVAVLSFPFLRRSSGVDVGGFVGSFVGSVGFSLPAQRKVKITSYH